MLNVELKNEIKHFEIFDVTRNKNAKRKFDQSKSGNSEIDEEEISFSIDTRNIKLTQ